MSALETRRGWMLASVAVATLAPALACAQPSAGPRPASPAVQGGAELSEVVVTARRRSESLQTVPVAVTALSGEFLERQNIIDVTAIPQFAPNLSILQQSGSPTAASVFIRGIGNQEPSAVAEQGVGIYLDGVYIARSAGALFDLVDLERLEVLRGPQGTLFGRNTVGGAVQLVSRKPRNEFHAEGKAGFGTDNDWFVRGRIDTGYIGGSKIKASLSAQHHERDGYVDNLLRPDNEDPGALKADALFLGIQGDFDPVTVNYSFDYNKRVSFPDYAQTVVATPDVANYFGQSASLGGAPFILSRERLSQGLQTGFIDREGRNRADGEAEISGHSLTVTYDHSDALILKSITAYRRFFQDTILTLTGQGDLRGVVLDPVTFAPSIAPVALYTGNNAPQRQWQFSQELQALGSVGQFDYVLGAYYFHEKASENNRQFLSFVLPGFGAALNLTPVQAFGGKTISKAVFGQLTWKPTMFEERLELTGGLRYTEDEKVLNIGGDVQPGVGGRVKFDDTSWLISANYQFTPTIMAYGRISTGYRSGGINPRAAEINTFAPEKALAYEAGVKSELFDRRLRLNVSAFLTDYDDLQIQQFAAGSGGATSLIVNAGKVQFRGVEAEFTLIPTEGITIDGSAGYTDPDFETYLYRDPLTNELINVGDEARMPQAAKFNAHLGAQYVRPVAGAVFTARADYSYRGEMYFFSLDRVNPFNEDIKSDPDHNLKARLSLSEIAFHGGELEVGVWGDNLTDQENIAFAIDWGSLGFGTASFKRPRSAGIDVKLTF
jgi:iron complex outermembrane recepter protein